MNKSKIITLSIFSVTGLCLGIGGVISGWAVTDQADPFHFLIALEDISSHQVRFMNSDNTVYYSENVLDNHTLSNPPSDPTLEGYTFAGWTTNGTTYEQTSDNISSKQYTIDTTYYPRFASYGYQVGSNPAQHLSNTWDINNNTTIAANASLKLGTYIKNKSSLENATSAVTIPNAGGYALVCDSHGSAWDSSKAGVLSNWHIERYYELTITNNWANYGLFAHFYIDDNTHDTRMMSDNLVSGSKYYVYAPYNMTNVIFGALYEDNKSAVNNDWSNVKYQLQTELGSTTSYELVDRTFTINYGTNSGKGVFMAGDFHSNFSVSTAYRLSWTAGNNWTGTFSFIKGSTINFKFVIADYDTGKNANTWESDPNRSESISSTGSKTYYWR